MKYLLLFLVLVAFIARSQEQVEKCGTHIEEAKLWAENPELEAAYMEMRNIAATQNVTKGNQVYSIPIVFHVVHEYGDENISDEQIYRQLEILNEDFRKLNSDTVDIVPEFKGKATDAKIEFVLATVDNYGNCTNGITRHFSSETTIGDDYSKINQWPRSRYLNVWTVKSMEGGTAGYAFYPSSVEGNNRFRDGIIIRHNYIGDIGTSNATNARALTHEIGHYLGLAHLWGPTNEPGLAGNCAVDDGIADTPNTIGWTACNLAGTTCNNELDNVQNFMEYSYCSNMYTADQVSFIRNILEQEVSQRSNLWTQENLDISIPSGAICDPIADFHANRLLVCQGDQVQFKNFSWRLSGNNPSYTWSFQDGNASDLNAENPTVTFTSPGWKDVTLTVVDNGVTNTIVKEDFIRITTDWPLFGGVHQFDFENNPDYWIIQNPQGLEQEWAVKNDVGKNGGGGIFLNMTTPYQDPIIFSPAYFFNMRRGGSKHSFVTPSMDFSYMTNIGVSFDWACATDASELSQITEKLVIYSSKDCGKTWQQRKVISGTDLVNNGSGWASFRPNQGTTLWDNESFTLPSIGNHVQFKFEYTGSDNSNNIAIDNINISGTLSTEGFQKEDNLSIYPNPTNQADGWDIKYDPSQWGGAKLQLTDMSGRVISSSELPTNQSEYNIKPAANATQGVYILKVVNGEKVVQNKLILK
ncbi:T9SS type A sorting domain-containing protein [Brumimicrobium glaciale]|uniref:T9SS type A sorting domain-containing protein n=1 Tax=Brumimicrobium glaciale TaxID=200475 RepID=A0A4Q4KPY1_9FLAO|nr:M43 family zinc metalloprotease [Brumimicrobium glaciale]RYM35447.1 T9SS type A sorting domain-containing protein [Brumimicrobium glaciale]